MNRRAFLKAFTGGVVGAGVIAAMPKSAAVVTKEISAAPTFSQIKVVFDAGCPEDTIYFMPDDFWQAIKRTQGPGGSFGFSIDPSYSLKKIGAIKLN